MAKKGLFIVFEGIDGGGKSTQINLLKGFFEEMGYNVEITQEPTRNKIGNLIRKYSKSKKRNLQPGTESLLFAADRIEHSREIKKMLKKGIVIISDRYLHSSLAYQGAAGVDTKWIGIINQKAIKPDLTILLDIDPEISLKRVENREKTVFEEENYLEKVREIYLALADIGELEVVNASRKIEDVHIDVLERVKRILHYN
jgi:dTMP kinase